MTRRLPTMAIAALILAGSVLSASPASSAGAKAPRVTKSQLKSKLVSLSQLPTGWSVDNSGDSGSTGGGCLSAAKKAEPHKGNVQASASYENGSVPFFEEQLGAGSAVTHSFNAVQKLLNACKHLSITSSGSTYSATVGAMSFPKVGSRSDAYQANFSIKGLTLGLDIVIFQEGQYGDVLIYGDLGAPSVSQMEHLAKLSLTDLGVPSPSTTTLPA